MLWFANTVFILLFILTIFGVKEKAKMILFIFLVLATIAASFAVGGLLGWFAHPDLFREVPVLNMWTTEYLYSDDVTFGSAILMVPFYAFLDLCRTIVHLNIHAGSLWMWIPEAIGAYTILNFYIGFYRQDIVAARILKSFES